MKQKRLFTWKWFLTTVLVLVAMAVMIRLGVWQLDRLAQRRAFNAHVITQSNLPALDLTGKAPFQDLTGMEYRKAVVRGKYLLDQAIVLRNQYWNGQYGVHLLTPLLIEGSRQAIMIDRGWIPAEDSATSNLSQFDVQGQVQIKGIIRLSHSKPDFGFIKDPTPVPGGNRIEVWNLMNLSLMQKQVSQPLLPVYIQESPDSSRRALPYPSEPNFDLTEGPHLSYAIQWFSFTTVLGLGYPFFVRRELRRQGKMHEKNNETH